MIKKIITAGALMFLMNTKAQDIRTNISIYAEPQHYSEKIWNKADGFNIGFGVEKQATVIYYGAKTFYFPNLNNIDYIDITGFIGLNQHSRNEKWRFNEGIKLGVIGRNWVFPYPVIGFELGVELYFNDSFGIGLLYNYDYRGDDKYWNPKGEGHEVWSIGTKFIIII